MLPVSLSLSLVSGKDQLTWSGVLERDDQRVASVLVPAQFHTDPVDHSEKLIYPINHVFFLCDIIGRSYSSTNFQKS